MAKLFYIEEQNQALKEIQTSLKTLASLTETLTIENADEIKFKVTGTNSNNEKKNTTVSIPYELLIPALKEYRKRLASTITAKSKQFHIQLDPEEEALLSTK